MDGLCFLVGLFLDASFNRKNSPYLFFEFLFGMAVRFVDRLGRLPQIMELTQLVWHVGKDRCHSTWDNIEGLVRIDGKNGAIDWLQLRQPASQEIDIHTGIHAGQSVVKITKHVPHFINVNRYTRFIPLSPFGGYEKKWEQSRLFQDLRLYAPQAFSEHE